MFIKLDYHLMSYFKLYFLIRLSYGSSFNQACWNGEIKLLFCFQIFPAVVREFGAASQALTDQVLLFLKWLALNGGRSAWYYKFITQTFWGCLPLGILLTCFFMPETKDLPLTQTEKGTYELKGFLRATEDMAEEWIAKRITYRDSLIWFSVLMFQQSVFPNLLNWSSVIRLVVEGGGGGGEQKHDLYWGISCLVLVPSLLIPHSFLIKMGIITLIWCVILVNLKKEVYVNQFPQVSTRYWSFNNVRSNSIRIYTGPSIVKEKWEIPTQD